VATVTGKENTNKERKAERKKERGKTIREI